MSEHTSEPTERSILVTPEVWSDERLMRELEERTRQLDEDGQIPGYQRMGLLQANRGFDKVLGIPWIQAVVEANEDAVVAQRLEGLSYEAFEPIPPAPQGFIERIRASRRAKRAAKMGKHAASN